jgi:hypothetical protein
LGYFSSQSVLTKIRSNFSYVGVCKLFAHIYCLQDSSNSLKSKLFITALNKNGHLSSYLVLFFYESIAKLCLCNKKIWSD